MSLGKKLAPLATVFAITVTVNTSIRPTFAQSAVSAKASTISPSQVAEPILASGVTAIALTALGMLTTVLSGKNRQQQEVEIKQLEEITNPARKKQVANFVLTSRSNQIYISDERIQTSVTDLIKHYHTQALTQAATQFWFSITAASFGFMLILYTGFTTLKSKEPQVVILNILPGVAIEAVAALFFTQAENTRKRATQLYDRLRADEKQTQAIAIIESIDDQALKDLVKAQWALQFAGLQSQPLDLNPYLSQSEISDSEIYDGEYSDN